MGIKSPVTGLGYNSVIRLLSSKQLWNGAAGSSSDCRCTKHATHDDFLEDGPRHARFFEESWRAIHGFVFAQAFSNTRLFRGADSTPRALLRKPARVPSYQTHLVGGSASRRDDPTGEGQTGKVLAFPTEQRNRQKARKKAGHVAKKHKTDRRGPPR